jgi:hypothetical protein
MRYEIACAVNIQRVFRGSFDREIVRALRLERYYYEVYIPSVIKVQSFLRGCVARLAYKQTHNHEIYAIKIQTCFRKYLWHQKAKLRWQKAVEERRDRVVILIQKTVRMFLAKLFFHRIMLVNIGKELNAAKVIVRTWMGYCMRRKYETLRDKHRLRVFAGKIVSVQNARAEVEDDLIETREDIKNVSKSMESLQLRIKDLKAFLWQTENRFSTIISNIHGSM